jgi:kumamolisin
MLYASLHAQTTLPVPSPSSNRVVFAQSIKEIASVPAAEVVRSALTQAELEATLDFSISLKMRAIGELQKRAAEGEIVSPNEMAEKYYPTQADYNKVAEWLAAQGFVIRPADKYSLNVFAHGTLLQIERSFGTKFGLVNFADVKFISALSAPSLPAEVAAPVLGINGLQPYLHPKPHSIIKATGIHKLVNNQPPYTVAEIAKAYNANGLNSNGSGQKIGIVIDTFPNNSDLTEFWNFNGIAQSLNNIEKVQVVPGTLPSPSGEESLDVEWSSGMAPAAKVRVYATTDLSFVHIDQAFQTIINDLPDQPGLRQISISLGLGELYASVNQMQNDAQYFASMAAAGVTVFVSSGDGGSSPGPSGHDHSGPVQVETYANDPSVTAVGGTTLNLNVLNGTVSSESTWFDGGGGFSTIFSRPSWQTGPGVPTGSTRLVPDVALAADPNTGAILFLGGVEYQIGGTSWSAPTWAGFCAMINQARANISRPPVGLLGPKIYPLIGTSNFRDITAGGNGPNGVYNAGPGYDLCTGVGAPNIANLFHLLTIKVNAVAKDFNGDGFADLVWENTSTGQRAIWFLNNGAWSSAVNLPTVPIQWRIAGVGDFNGDGNADLVLENTSTGQHAIWLLNNGVYSSSVNLPTVATQWRVAGAGDFNDDGYADLVWENTSTGQRAIWFLNNGALSSAVNLPTVVVAWKIEDH